MNKHTHNGVGNKGRVAVSCIGNMIVENSPMHLQLALSRLTVCALRPLHYSQGLHLANLLECSEECQTPLPSKHTHFSGTFM